MTVNDLMATLAKHGLVADIAEDNTTYVVSVVDVINATENLKKVQVLSGLVDK